MSDYSVDIARMEALTAGEFHDVVKLRVDVFVVEQNCPYPEIDGKDPEALHMRLRDDNGLFGYARLFAPPASSGPARIGRVIVAPSHRGQNMGRAVMREAVTACEKLWPDTAISISAQAHLQNFYAGFGFVVTSEEYLEDGIPHVDMLRKPAAGAAA
ncbi:GNAT family N-acetyltransferase [uncultured Martelella sp.]|uniref:GNAT family N-acetyltransferase n=1 Tax=uncultured Martelella sp. TaxID=392331 RepID=UPI0029C7E7D3|nr:GNAT family N-acetyltransferase [uncultured Martelella sp.]